MNVITTRLALTFHIHDQGAGPWRKPCLALHLLFVMPRFVRRSWWLHHCPRLAPRGSSVFAPACTPGSFACVPPACTPGVFCCAAVLPAGGGGGGWFVQHEHEEVHTRARGLRVRGAGSSLHPARLVACLNSRRSTSASSAASRTSAALSALSKRLERRKATLRPEPYSCAAR